MFASKAVKHNKTRCTCIFYIDSIIITLFYALKYMFIICTLIVCSEIDIAINMYSSYTAFGDLELFLHGLGLEHMTDLLKVRFCMKYNELCMRVYLLINITLN